MTSTAQDHSFKKAIGAELPNSLLGSTLDWIRDNLSADQVFEQSRLNKFVGDTAQPAEVFDEKELHEWAQEKGYKKISEYPSTVAAKIAAFVNKEAGREIVTDHNILNLL